MEIVKNTYNKSPAYCGLNGTGELDISLYRIFTGAPPPPDYLICCRRIIHSAHYYLTNQNKALSV